MKELTVEEQKKIILDILVDFDSLCRRNGIKYSLAYGTLLGAVRHGGFIPWDDDIDVIVTRDDYVRLAQIASSQLDGRHRFVCVENTEGFSAPLGKIIDTTTVLEQTGHNSDRIELGCYIDVFPYDWVPEDSNQRARVLKKAVFLQKMWSFAGNDYGDHSAVVTKVRRLLNKTSLARAVSSYTNRWAASHEYEKTMMASLAFGLPKREKNIMLFEDLSDVTEYDFEGIKFMGIRRSDHYLKQWYGDYMTLPPEEKRVRTHDTKVYRKDAK